MLSNKEFYKRIGFIVDDKYRLELRWSGVSYSKGQCIFKDAAFSGPTMKYADKIGPNNSILLDLYKQFFMYAKAAYLATLSWDNVSYLQDGMVAHLSNVRLNHINELNKFPKIRSTDYIVINTKGHDSETHMFNPTYVATVVNSTGEAYNFWNIDGRFRKVNSG